MAETNESESMSFSEEIDAGSVIENILGTQSSSSEE